MNISNGVNTHHAGKTCPHENGGVENRQQTFPCTPIHKNGFTLIWTTTS